MFAITLATVNVLPDPVTPNKTWLLSPRSNPSVNSLIASGWSPVGLYFDVNLKFIISVKRRTIFGWQRYENQVIVSH